MKSKIRIIYVVRCQKWLLDRLSRCGVDMNVFAGACFMCSGSDCVLHTQRQITDALVDFKRNNFTF